MDDFTEDWYKFSGNPSNVDNTIITGTEGDNIILSVDYRLSGEQMWSDFGYPGKAPKVTINSGSGNDSIRSSSSQGIINAGDGNNCISDNTYGDLVITGNGDDSIFSYPQYYYVVDDQIITTIDSGAGNDFINALTNTFLLMPVRVT